MRKLKIYLDTSVISHLYAPDTSDKMNDTLNLWEIFKQDEYDVYISDTVLTELYDCSQPKRQIMLEYLSQIEYNELEEIDEVTELADKYITAGFLKTKNYDDCMHLAFAVVNYCDIIISWNFKHIVNLKTIQAVNQVNYANGYLNPIQILPPNMLLKGDD